MLRGSSPTLMLLAGVPSRSYVISGLIVGAATLLCFLLNELPLANLALVFLMAVILVASLFGAAAAIFASLLSVLSFNFFFTAPHFTLRVNSQEDVATLLLFLLIAGITGNLAARMRRAIDRSEVALDRMSTLYQFSRLMNASSDSSEILRALTAQVSALANVPAAAFICRENGTPTLAAWEGRAPGSEIVAAVGRVAATGGTGTAEGRHTEVVLNLATPRQLFGYLAIDGAQPKRDRLELIETLAEQAALAYERSCLATDLEQAKVATETERLRSALLSSVSHDLRTPLASIIGGASSLLDLDRSLDDNSRRELQTSILNEAEKLNRYIQNLLDMTRFGRGEIALKCDWVDLFDVVSGAIGRLQRELAPYRVSVNINRDAAIVCANGPFLEQMLVNLLDNAARYSPEGGAISVAARRSDRSIFVEVIDEGEGVSEAERDRIFDMFYSTDKGDRRAKGVGLGLTICRAIASAHKGSICALPGANGRGTCIQVILPAGDAPAGDTSDE